LNEGNGSDPLPDEPRQEPRGNAVGGAYLSTWLLARQDGVPDGHGLARCGASVLVDHLEGQPDEAVGQFAGVGHGGRGSDEERTGSVALADSAQPAEDVGDIAAEDAVVGVQLIDHDELDV